MNEGKKPPKPITEIPKGYTMEYKNRAKSKGVQSGQKEWGALVESIQLYDEALALKSYNLDGALERFKKILGIEKTPTRALIQIGLIYMRKKDFKTAKSYLEKCLENNELSNPDRKQVDTLISRCNDEINKH